MSLPVMQFDTVYETYVSWADETKSELAIPQGSIVIPGGAIDVYWSNAEDKPEFIDMTLDPAGPFSNVAQIEAAAKWVAISENAPVAGDVTQFRVAIIPALS